MSTISELALVFGGIIAEYAECKEYDAPIESVLLKELVTDLQEGRVPRSELIDYSMSPVLYKGMKFDECSFRRACQDGHLEFAKWLQKRVKINDKLINFIFRKTCEHGRLEVAKWLKTEWPLIDPMDEDNEAFCLACQNGHLETAKWLKTQWSNFVCDIEVYQALKMTCQNGHREVIKWLIDTCPLEASQENKDDFFWLALYGHKFKTAKWLKDDVWNDINLDHAYFRACSDSNMSIINWLKKTWPTVDAGGRIRRLFTEWGWL